MMNDNGVLMFERAPQVFFHKKSNLYVVLCWQAETDKPEHDSDWVVKRCRITKFRDRAHRFAQAWKI